MAERAATEVLRHPFAEALLRFNLLPSLLLHPRREPSGIDGLPALPSLPRHRSAALLQQQGFDPVMSMDDPALPLALLPPAHLDRLLLLLGAALNAPHIRRTIGRGPLAELKAQVGSEGLAIARAPTAAALAGLPVAPDWSPAQAGALCTAWGAALLAHAFEAAAPGVAQRARLRLPPEADALRAPLAAAGLQPERALAAARQLLQTLEPAWLSSFPAPR